VPKSSLIGKGPIGVSKKEQGEKTKDDLKSAGTVVGKLSRTKLWGPLLLFGVNVVQLAVSRNLPILGGGCHIWG